MKIYKYDLYRYFGDKKRSLFQFLFPALEIRYIKWFRKTQKKRSLFSTLILRLISKKTHIQIPPECNIGPGFQILHFGRIVFNHHVIVGQNCTVCPGVLIGQEDRGTRRGNPVLGDYVFVGTNAVIVGKVRIGSNVMIAPNSFINFDVPDNSIVVGNPGRVISSENATEQYIKNAIKVMN